MSELAENIGRAILTAIQNFSEATTGHINLRMYALGAEDLKTAENILKQYFPESLKSRQDCRDRESSCNMCHIFAKDPQSLITLLSTPGFLDWSQPTLLAGVDSKHLAAVKELAFHKNMLTETMEVIIVMTLEDASHLQGPESSLVSRLQPLEVAHAEKVNCVWKFGPNEINLNSVRSYISSYPSLCVTAEDGEPVSWLLLYHHGALGRLYTSPEHRRKGHARLLLSTMARLLLEQGRPVYGFVEEDNVASVSLFTSLGFSHKPDYRSVWLQLNPE